jgi:gliding motility-associated-like protein
MNNLFIPLRKTIMSIIFCIIMMQASSQITVDNYTTFNNTQTANALVDSLMGAGVTFTNASFQGVRISGTGYQTAYFTTTGVTETQMGLSKGVALTSGNTNLISIPLAQNPAATQSFAAAYTSCTTGEIRKSGTCGVLINDLNVLSAGENYYNAAILEFDFIPVGDSIVFRYVFGSEEYTDNTNFTNYQCTEYNDKFGFLVSGPGISGGAGYTNDAINIARLANGSEVGINSVNNGTVGTSAVPNGPVYCQNANIDWVQNTPVPEYNGPISGTAPNGNTDVLFATLGGLTPGATYHIRLLIMDARDATYDAVVYIEAGSFTSPQPTSSINAYPQTICEGDSTLIVVNQSSGTPPFTYTWSNGTVNNSSLSADSIIVWPVADSTFSVTVTDALSNTSTSSITITVLPVPDASITPAGPFCSEGSSVTLNAATPGGTWSGTGITNPTAGTFDPGNAGAGNHEIIYSVSGMCPAADTATVTVILSADASINSAGPFCLSDSAVQLTAVQSGGLWSGSGITDPNNGTFDPSVAGAGTHTISHGIAGQCGDTSDIQITVHPLPDITVSANPQTICSGDSALLTANGGISYVWSPSGTGGSHYVTPSSTTVWNVTGTDVYGCINTAQVTVNVTDNYNATIDPVTPMCQNAAAFNLSAADGGGAWSGTGITDPVNGTFDPQTSGPGDHIITYAIGGNCGDTSSVTITVWELPQIDYTTTSEESCTGAGDGSISILVTGGASPYSYLWMPSGSGSQTIGLETGSYSVTVTDDNSCTSDIVIVLNDPGIPCESINYHIFIPNVFSPNGDGQNDVLYVRGEGIETLEFLIFNRWGEIVFESTSTDQGWDGNYRNRPAESAVFAVTVKGTFSNGQEFQIFGNVTLVR